MFHPAVTLVIWSTSAIIIQTVGANGLIVLTLLCGVIAARLCLKRTVRLLRRIRWLLLTIFILFLWGIPGTLLVPDWGTLSPTYEGLQAALLHSTRLFDTVILVAIFLELVTPEQIVVGLYSLLAPVAKLGFDRISAVTRVMLVLRYVELKVPVKQWRTWLDDDDGGEVSAIRLDTMPWRLSDVVLLMTISTGFILWWAQ